ncbi:MAG: glycosyltransferase [Candidatus Nealsonbacteria bacterium]
MNKILFLVTQSEMGGAQRYIYEIARLLDKNVYEVMVAAGEPAYAKATAGKGDCEFFKKLEIIGVKSIQLKQMKRTPWPWQITKSVWEIRTLLKKEKPDILFLCSTTAGLLGSMAGFLCNRRPTSIIYRIGGWAFRDPRAFWKNWLILAAEKLTSPLKDLIIVNSEVDRKLALKYKIVPEGKLVKIYNGIDVNSLEFFSKEEARHLLTSDFNRLLKSEVNKSWIGCVANFYKTKGLEHLIEAASRLNLKGERFSLIIIGDGRERPKLEMLIKKYGLENKVILAGRIPDAYRYLKAFDVFVLPSLKEGFPWIILEAIAAQIPIVATNVGALPEILDEEFLVAPGNAEALAKKIGRVLEYPTEPKLKPEFTSQKMLAETLEALQKQLPRTA